MYLTLGPWIWCPLSTKSFLRPTVMMRDTCSKPHVLCRSDDASGRFLEGGDSPRRRQYSGPRLALQNGTVFTMLHCIDFRNYLNLRGQIYYTLLNLPSQKIGNLIYKTCFRYVWRVFSPRFTSVLAKPLPKPFLTWTPQFLTWLFAKFTKSFANLAKIQALFLNSSALCQHMLFANTCTSHFCTSHNF